MALRKKTKTLLDLAPNIIAATGVVQAVMREHKLEERKIALLADIKQWQIMFWMVAFVFLGAIIALLYQLLGAVFF